MDIEGRVALVTGANRGLGKTYVEALLSARAKKVHAGARQPSQAGNRGVTTTTLVSIFSTKGRQNLEFRSRSERACRYAHTKKMSSCRSVSNCFSGASDSSNLRLTPTMTP